ncbi:MAG TPA: hypothetical protein VE684_12260, partial [Crenalkalicoccus sp.]|nr:hypothetical protein [Crenalkalicoccus sp.]
MPLASAAARARCRGAHAAIAGLAGRPWAPQDGHRNDAGARVLRRLRLASGLVLFAYLAWHLGNAGLAIVSLGTADAALVTVYPLLTSWPVTGVLLAALLTHFALALW